MKKLFTLAFALASTIGFAASAQSLGTGEIVSGVEDGASYTTYQSEVVVTWGEDNIQFVSDDPRFNLYFYDYAYPQWPDNWGVGGNAEIVSVNGGTKNAVRFTFDSYTSQLDPSDYFGPRLTKYGEFTLTIPEGFVKSPSGAENDVQEIFWKQVETIYSEDPEPIVTGEIDNLTSTDVTVTFTPNQDVAGYYVCLFEPSVEAYFEMIGSMFGFLDPTEMIITFGWYEQTGVYTESWDELTPENDYEIGIAVRGLDGLYVPYQSVAFTTPSDSSTAVNGINSDSEAVYYDLNGKRIMNPEKGMMLIKVQNGKTTKVIK